ncbi:MAG: YeiH family putative sulfate export transporter [Firmicutes bacterium]|nr:YeiH family putative sulfate export transporter [Bacillota bacterium]
MKKIRELAPGMIICVIIAAASTFVVNKIAILEIMGAPVLGIITGIILGSTLKPAGRKELKAGIAFSSKKILQWAVILLGFGLNLATVGKVGITSLPIILSTIGTSWITAYIVFRLFKVPGKTATLIGVGSSICGGSAIAATAPVIDASDEEIAQSVSVVFLFNVAAALIYPTLGDYMGLSDMGFGLFAGTAINDTSSVTAAASVWDTIHGTDGKVLEYATIVKLTRTLAIIPITLCLSVIQARKTSKEGKKLSIMKMVPTFIIYFVAASAVTTAVNQVFTGGALETAAEVFGFLKKVSKFFIVTAMSAIGMNTDIVKLIKSGAKPIGLGFCCWTMIGVVSLIMQKVLGLW